VLRSVFSSPGRYGKRRKYGDGRKCGDWSRRAEKLQICYPRLQLMCVVKWCGQLIITPKNMSMSQSQESVNVTLFGKRDFADAIKLRILR